MRLLLPLAFFVISGLASASCLNISGTYDMGQDPGQPRCADGISVISAYYNYQQVECSEVVITKQFKLADGGNCSEQSNIEVADGLEHSNPGAGYAYKYQILTDRHVFTLINLSTGIASTEVKTLDSRGDLVIDGSDGSHQVLRKVSE